MFVKFMSNMTLWRRAILIFVLSGPVLGEEVAQVCVVRPENVGPLNRVPAHITVAGAGTLLLTGGSSGCLKIAPGKIQLAAQSTAPDQAEEIWRSNTATPSIPSGQITTLFLCPMRHGSEDCCGWQLGLNPCEP